MLLGGDPVHRGDSQRRAACPGLVGPAVPGGGGTTLALLFQNVGQKYTDPSSAAVLLALEAPFGVAFSVLFAEEAPTPFMYLGFALIFVAVVCSETKFDFLRRARTPAES